VFNDDAVGFGDLSRETSGCGRGVVVSEISTLLHYNGSDSVPIAASQKLNDPLMVTNDLAPISRSERDQVRDRLQRLDCSSHRPRSVPPVDGVVVKRLRHIVGRAIYWIALL